MGMRLAVNEFKKRGLELLEKSLADGCINPELAGEIKTSTLAEEAEQAAVEKQRERIEQLKKQCQESNCPTCRELLTLADYLVHKSVWAVGGDGWAYDIGYGGLDHVLASGANVNVLVLDTEVYSNTGGQMSKSTPRAAIAKFAAAGKPTAKKVLAVLAMTYGNIYVARVAIGANPGHTVKAFIEAEKYNGPSLIIAYSHCIAHGYNLTNGYEHQKQAVASGYWPLCRFNPELKQQGKNPLQLDSKAPTVDFEQYAYSENRYRALKQSQPQLAPQLMELAKKDVAQRLNFLQSLANLPSDSESK